MKYRCSNCHELFEGEPERCPNCGTKLAWKNKAISVPTCEIDVGGSSVLRQLNLIKALYSCYRVNSVITETLGRQASSISIDISDCQGKTAEQMVVKHDYKKPKLFVPISLTPEIAKGGAFIVIALSIISAIVAGASHNDKVGMVCGIIVGSLHLIYVLAIIISGIAHGVESGHYEKIYKNELKEAKEYNKKIDEDYQLRLKNYAINQKNELIKLENKRKVILARKEKYAKYESTAKEAFEKVLNTSVVHPKYRDIVPICQFIDYLDTKRCWSLIGADGCYNKYEEELRQNLIISKLESIEYHLERIEDNQQVLARTLKSIDANCRSIYSVACNIEDKFGDVKENLTAINSCQKIIASYNAEIASNTNQIINDMAYYYRN